ncbi:hypothetical protein GE061_007775 [Apolygus lucorum]|uniref:Uncharacterized protein n=1 Tax=Apolygus lucorum TaxID=248454 RepID=A0A6A4ITK6_APOLU|nr:hypothetical protein GE061_007775 [Apolygus lucorum]
MCGSKVGSSHYKEVKDKLALQLDWIDRIVDILDGFLAQGFAGDCEIHNSVMDENDVVLATLHGEVTSINMEGSPTTLSTTPAQQETVVSSSDDACDTRLSHVVVRRTLQTIIQLEQELATLMEDQEKPDFARMAELEARLDELYDALPPID